MCLAVPMKPAADLFRGREVDHRAGRSRGAERKARELEPRRSLLGDVADDIERVGLRLLVVVLVEDLEAVVNRADGADHVMADLARDERGELEVGGLCALVHRFPCGLGDARSCGGSDIGVGRFRRAVTSTRANRGRLRSSNTL